MIDLTSPQAAKVIGTNRVAIYRAAESGLLKARRQGVRGMIRIDVNDLRTFAQTYGYKFNEDLAKTYTEEAQ